MKKTLLIVLLFIGSLTAKAQNESGKWSFGASFTMIDFSGPQTKQFFNLKQYRGAQRYFVGRYLDPSFNLKADFTFGKVWFPKVSAYPEVYENVYENRHIYDFGLNVEYKLNNGYILKETAIVAPYIFTGLGFNTIIDYGKAKGTDINTYIPFGAGLTVRATNWLSFNLQSGYKLNLDNSYDYLQHSLGAVLNIGGKPKGTKVTDIETETIDSDKDGVVDLVDECPFAKGTAAMYGCPDTDGDGLGDSRDDCPQQAGALINKGCPAKDTDGDGISDDKDSCPNVKGEKRYAGCPDTDGDGIVDKYDKCPNKAGTASNSGCPANESGSIKTKTSHSIHASNTHANTKVSVNASKPKVTTSTSLNKPSTTVTYNATTNPKKSSASTTISGTVSSPSTSTSTKVSASAASVSYTKPSVKTTNTTITGTVNNPTVSTISSSKEQMKNNIGNNIVKRVEIYFNASSEAILSSEQAKLSSVVSMLRGNSGYRAHIKGYSNDKGNYSANSDLSLKRATAVWTYLTRNGMKGDKADLFGYGEADQGKRKVVIEIVN